MQRASRVICFAASIACALTNTACGDDDEGPAGPVGGSVLLDASGILEAVPGATDTLHVSIPAGRVMGVIVESPEPIAIRYGPGRFDVVVSSLGTQFGAIVGRSATDLRLIVGRSTSAVVEAPYRLRIIAVDEAPEHLPEALSPGVALRSEWIDPPLDLDVFTIDFDEGERFFVELESGAADLLINMVIVEPDGFGSYVFIGQGDELTRSGVHQILESGEHRLMVYLSALNPDAQTRYRFRVVLTDAPAGPPQIRHPVGR